MNIEEYQIIDYPDGLFNLVYLTFYHKKKLINNKIKLSIK